MNNGYEIKQGVPVDMFLPNPWNPNVMEEDKFSILVENIRQEGFMLQPILATPSKEVEGKYTIIDGEHRWKASKEAGVKTIDAVVISSSLVESQLKTLGFNNLRGVNDRVKMGMLLDKLITEIGRDVVMEKTGLTALEIGINQGRILESMTSEQVDKVESVKQALISVGINEDTAKSMAEVAVVEKPILVNVDIKGDTVGRTVPLTFYFDNQEQHDEVYDFFKKEKGIEPDSVKLLNIVKTAKGVAI